MKNIQKITILTLILIVSLTIVSGCSLYSPFKKGGKGDFKPEPVVNTPVSVKPPFVTSSETSEDKPEQTVSSTPNQNDSGQMKVVATSTPNNSEQAEENNIASSTDGIDTSDWKTYRNEELGIKFKYPKYLKVEDNGMSLSINYDLKEIYNNKIINITFQITPKSIEDQIQYSFGNYPYNIDVIANKIYKVDSFGEMKTYIKNGDYTIIISKITPVIITADDLPPSEIKSIYNKLINTFEIFNQSTESINNLYKKDINYIDPALYNNFKKNFIIKEGKIYYVDYNNSLVELKDVDVDSLEPTPKYGLVKDKNSVYFRGNKINNFDAQSFEFITDYYFKDKNNLYYLFYSGGSNQDVIKKVENIDINNIDIVKITCPEYIKDDNNVFFQDKKINGTDPQTFKCISPTHTIDKNNAYYRGSKIDGADVETFKVIDVYESYDKNNRYYEDEIIKQ